MTQAVARVRSWVSPCGICGGQSGTRTGFSPSTQLFPCQFHFAGAPLLGKMKKWLSFSSSQGGTTSFKAAVLPQHLLWGLSPHTHTQDNAMLNPESCGICPSTYHLHIISIYLSTLAHFVHTTYILIAKHYNIHTFSKTQNCHPLSTKIDITSNYFSLIISAS